MTPTRTQVENWTPGSLLTWRDGWRSLGTSIERLFDDYVAHVEKVDGQYWEGVAAEAAFERAHSDRTTARSIVDTLERVAGSITTGYHAIKGNLDGARDALATAQENCFTITENLEVIDPRTEEDADREAFRVGLQINLQRYASLAEQADLDLTRSLEEARTSLRIAFTSAAALGDTQAVADATALTTGNADAETLHRIAESGTLTPEQLADLHGGETTSIPASQMEYLNTMARSLDALSPQELEQLMSTLPEDARAGLANSLQIISTDAVTVATSGDPDVPARGSFDLLPEGIRDSLSRDDRVVHSVEAVGGTALRQTTLHGVPDTHAIASIVAAGDGDYRHGSDLDKNLLAAGREYLEAQVTHDQGPQRHMTIFEVDGHLPGDPYLDPIFAAVSDDRVVVEHAVTDANGSDFIRDILTHSWSDESAAAPMFHFDELEGAVQDPNDPVDVAEATRSGRIMSAVASAMSTDAAWQQLSSIPGTGHQSIGEVNPELVRTISHSMTPYIPRLVNIGLDDRPGFDNEGWLDPIGNETYLGSANVFAALNTDELAGKCLNSRALEEATAAEFRYGQNPYESGATNHLTTAGRLLGLTDRGIELAIQDQHNDTAAREKELYDRKADAYNAVTWVGGHVIPGSDLFFDLVSAGGNPLKDIIIGTQPADANIADINDPALTRHYYLSLTGAHALPPEIALRYPYIVDENGSIKPYAEILGPRVPDDHANRREGELREVFNLYGPQQGQGSAINNAYGLVRRNHV
ncbi:hypothetical protein MWU77_21645 [Rhodococcus sp. F64268]|uniref:TPR repeat region-containing protein n=1 Tax=Rhodococcus sp. F64268 TaxID=2926402 RepID=UPI001FF440FD|nr:hypothetical protein [Rhodococcus sp. F64268]MCK0093388.1 hypothetical protein [Rhodococcus sp. F64268]